MHELHDITGIGERKAAAFGPAILEVIATHELESLALANLSGLRRTPYSSGRLLTDRFGRSYP